MLPSPGPRTPLAPNARLRFDAISHLLADVARKADSFLEIGCGQGAAATLLAQYFDYIGYEPDPISFAAARRRLETLGVGTVLNSTLPDSPDRAFDLLGAFEVLEHINDDYSTLKEWVSWVRPGGHAIVSVPADPKRFGAWDTRVGHFRRYTRSDIARLLTEAGLVEIRVVTYGYPLGYALEWFRNSIASRNELGAPVRTDERTAASGRLLQPGRALAPVVWVGTLPFVWLQRLFRSTELGTGLVACGRRPA